MSDLNHDLHLDLSHASRPEAFLTRTSRKVRAAALQLALGLSGKFLDVACGNGLFLLEWYAASAVPLSAWGLDYDQRAIGEARRLSIENHLPADRFLVGDAFGMPFAAESFDAVFCLNTLINITPFERIERLLTEIYRVCRPGGFIIFDYRHAGNPYLAWQYFYNTLTHKLTTAGHRAAQFRPLMHRLNIRKQRRVAIPSPLPGLPLGYLNIWEK